MSDITPIQSRAFRVDRILLSTISTNQQIIRYLENLGVDVAATIPDNLDQQLELLNDISQIAASAQSSANTSSQDIQALAQEIMLLLPGQPSDIATLKTITADLEAMILEPRSTPPEVLRLAQSVAEIQTELLGVHRSQVLAQSIGRKLDEIEVLLLDLWPSRAPVAAYQASIVTITAALTVSSLQSSQSFTVRVDATAGAITVTLPAAPQAGQLVNIKKVDASANIVTISGNGNNIDGVATKTTATQYTNFQVQFNGATWDVL